MASSISSSNTKDKKKKTQAIFLNIAFVIVCSGILIFLLRAPKETTKPLPHDEKHMLFFAISDKKDAERQCLDCHGEGRQAPLSPTHPPKYRCLFCHKRLENQR
jgi:hypothetical protein